MNDPNKIHKVGDITKLQRDMVHREGEDDFSWFDVWVGSSRIWNLSVVAKDEIEALLIATGQRRPHARGASATIAVSSLSIGLLARGPHVTIEPYLRLWKESFEADGYEVELDDD